MLFEEGLDVVEAKDLEHLRQTWLGALDRPKVLVRLQPNEPEDIIGEALEGVMKDEDPKHMRVLIQEAPLPIPPDYTFSIPVMPKEDRVNLISALVPFQNTRSRLLALEDSLDLPTRIVRITSKRRFGLVAPTRNSLN